MGMFHGLGTVTLILIINNAAQGILSSFFFKFADTILKKYSSTIATLFTAVMSYAMFGHELTLNFIIGVSVVFISMHQFFTFGDKQPPGAERTSKSGRIAYSPSLEHLAAATHSGGLSLQVEGNNGHIPGGLGARTDLANAKNRSDADIAARASA